LRIFTDSDGVEWTVFDVSREARLTEDTRHLPIGFADGWLCFENPGFKRRLAPIPERWHMQPDTGLEAMLRKAVPVSRPRTATSVDDGVGRSAPM
jgi:hypothetical protein